MEKYVFKNHAKHYLEVYKTEKKLIEKAFGDKVLIEHVGSTAVSSLGGKGIVDIVVGLKNGELRDHVKDMEGIGYEFRDTKASTEERLFFRKDITLEGGTMQRIHVHLTHYNETDWKEMIAFRDYLRDHPEELPKYEKIKKEAVREANGVGQIYRDTKEEYMKRVTKKALSE